MDSIDLNYKVFGSGEPVIILHGLFGMLDNWQSFAKKLAEDYMVFIIDQRDHGRSPHTQSFDYDQLSEDLRHFMTSNWIYDVRLIGHSMGGKTAMNFALNNDDMVNQLVVVDMGIKRYKPGHEAIFKALASVPVKEVESRGEVDAILAQFVGDIGVRNFLMKNLQRDKEGGFRWKMNWKLLLEYYDNILKELPTQESIDTQTLFVRGSESNYLLEEDYDEIQTVFPNARIESIQAGHWIHADKPDELLRSVKSFFTEG